jgi:hypothetical protein
VTDAFVFTARDALERQTLLTQLDFAFENPWAVEAAARRHGADESLILLGSFISGWVEGFEEGRDTVRREMRDPGPRGAVVRVKLRPARKRNRKAKR